MTTEYKEGQDKIVQGTEAWLQAKQSKIGASEIFTLVAHYCKDELKQANIDLGNEKAFKTPLELYLKVKFGIQDDSISEVNSQFGLGMEEYILHRLGQEDSWKNNVVFGGSKDFVVNEKVNKMASCSPDGWIEVWGGNFEFRDYDDKETIDRSWGGGVLELKTTPFGFNFEVKKGLKWSYLFQLHYQMLVCNKKWGILAAITPKEKSYDTDFFKGKVLGYLKGVKDSCLFTENHNTDTPYKYLDKEDYYNLYHYIYPENETIQNLCVLALKRFQKALDDNILPRISTDCKERLQREKQLLAQMYPEKYGSMEATEELNGLLKDEREANTQALKDETERQSYICEIIEKMGTHIELVGTESKAKFSKNGSLRFTNLNKK